MTLKILILCFSALIAVSLANRRDNCASHSCSALTDRQVLLNVWKIHSSPLSHKLEHFKTALLADYRTSRQGGPPGQAGNPGNPGNPGQPGPQGPRGPPGLPGPAGPPGAPGAAGPAGPTGATGATGELGQQGPSGPTGPTGANGAAGETGAPGAAGAEGPQGTPGANGIPGNDGIPGVRGPPGFDGVPGSDGIPGVEGSPGPPGPAAPPGEPGVPGTPGNEGAAGAPGAAGPPGQNAPPGAAGPPGLPGPVAAPGVRGPSGVPGPAAAPGLPGPPGPPGGPAGTPGAPGLPGAPCVSCGGGLPGPPGPPGPVGPPGPHGEVWHLHGIRLIQSLWAIDVLTGFSPHPSMSCVFNELVTQTIAVQNGAKNKDLGRAVRDYGRLISESIYHAVGRQSVVGCPAEPWRYKAASSSQCHNTHALDTQLRSSDTLKFIPKTLVVAIEDLRVSDNHHEATIAAGAIAALTPASRSIFGQIVAGGNFHKFVRLMSCVSDSPTSNCCRDRRDNLRDLARDLTKQIREITDNFT